MGWVDNGNSPVEVNFMFPVAFERVYKNYWLKFAEENDLYWLKFFLYGIKVEKSSFDEVRKELSLFQEFLLKGEDIYYLTERKYILSRIELFLEKLDEAEKIRDDIVLYIG